MKRNFLKAFEKKVFGSFWIFSKQKKSKSTSAKNCRFIQVLIFRFVKLLVVSASIRKQLPGPLFSFPLGTGKTKRRFLRSHNINARFTWASQSVQHDPASRRQQVVRSRQRHRMIEELYLFPSFVFLYPDLGASPWLTSYLCVCMRQANSLCVRPILSTGQTYLLCAGVCLDRITFSVWNSVASPRITNFRCGYVRPDSLTDFLCLDPPMLFLG
jgi:hypothetical protein